jgi:hypothetical protein
MEVFIIWKYYESHGKSYEISVVFGKYSKKFSYLYDININFKTKNGEVKWDY